MANNLIFHLALMNLAGSVAILAVCALRRTARAQLGAGTAYALWLIVPVAMLASLAPPRTVLIAAPAAPVVALTQGVMASAAQRAATGPAFDVSQIVIGVWLAGVIASLVLLTIGQRRALARFGRITADAEDTRLGRAANASVGPALVGVVRPRVIVPSDFEARFDANERALILAHERTHLARGHASINGGVALLRAVNWFNPLIHLGARYARVDQELACDAAVVGRFPGARQTYAQALLKTQLAFMPLPLGCDWPVRSPSLLEQRIEMLAQGKPGRARLLGGGAIISVLTVGAGLAAWSGEPPVTRTTPAAPAAARSPVVAAPAAPPRPIVVAQASTVATPAPAPAPAPGAKPPPKGDNPALAAAIAAGDIRQALALGASATDVAGILQAQGRDIDPGTAAWVQAPGGHVALGYSQKPPKGGQVMIGLPAFADYVPPGGIDRLPTLAGALGPLPPPPPPSAALAAAGQMVMAGATPQDVATAMLAANGFPPPVDPADPALKLDPSTARFVRLPDGVGLAVAGAGRGQFLLRIPATQSYSGLAGLPPAQAVFPPPNG